MPRRKETRFKNFCMRGRYWLADDLVEGRRIFSFGRRLSLVESNINNNSGNSPAVQWLRLHTSTAGSMDSIPSWGTKISHATWHGQKGKKTIYQYYDMLLSCLCSEADRVSAGAPGPWFYWAPTRELRAAALLSPEVFLKQILITPWKVVVWT